MTFAKHLYLKEYITDDGRYFVGVREEPRTPINEPRFVVTKIVTNFTGRPEDIVAQQEFVNGEEAFRWALEIAGKPNESAAEDYDETLKYTRVVQKLPPEYIPRSKSKDK